MVKTLEREQWEQEGSLMLHQRAEEKVREILASEKICCLDLDQEEMLLKIEKHYLEEV